MRTYYILFIHPSVNGDLGWFHFLVIVNNAPTFVYMFSCECMLSFLLGIYLAMKLLGHVVTLLVCLTIWRMIKLFFKAITSFYIPTRLPYSCHEKTVCSLASFPWHHEEVSWKAETRWNSMGKTSLSECLRKLRPDGMISVIPPLWCLI